MQTEGFAAELEIVERQMFLRSRIIKIRPRQNYGWEVSIVNPIAERRAGLCARRGVEKPFY